MTTTTTRILKFPVLNRVSSDNAERGATYLALLSIHPSFEQKLERDGLTGAFAVWGDEEAENLVPWLQDSDDHKAIVLYSTHDVADVQLGALKGDVPAAVPGETLIDYVKRTGNLYNI